MSADLSFRVGDKVVYPNHGVGVIEHIANRGDGGQDYYQLRIESSNLRVMVPLTNAASVGMRAVTESGAVTPVLNYLRKGERVECPLDWKWRFKENSDKMRNGKLAQVAEVLKSLVQLHQTKPLSFREKKMLDRAVVLLSNEVASANNLSTEQSLKLLEQALAKAELILPPLDAEETEAGRR